MVNQSMLVKRRKGDFHQAYRPGRISEVYGQDDIKEAIRAGLDEGSLPHSILFHGVSGTGKTTLGRIIAMGLNCEKGPTSEPCCECGVCGRVMRNSSLAFLEMNSADFTGIDHMRRIRSEFDCAPMGREEKKIYLFDECHGLSSAAQNALLKSVEDSLEHLYFIFCSTEPEKIIGPLRNRCMEFEFRELEDEIMWELMLDIVRKESYQPNREVMWNIIEQVKGKPRNAIHELQKAMACGKFSKMSIQYINIMEETQRTFGGITMQVEE